MTATPPNRWRDPDYLVREQYRDASNLQARIQLYRYGSNPVGWYQWLFDHFRVRAGGRILEIGCGPALLWKTNLEDVPSDWDITLSDLSPGMLDEARANLADADGRFTFARVNAESIPYASNSFDAVIAIHMLFHVPNRERALREVRRVLRPGGRFYASTVGKDHLTELDAILARCLPPGTPANRPDFTLERGAAELQAIFEQVSMDRYENVLRVPDIDPLLTYLGSGGSRLNLDGDGRKTFIRWARDEIARNGHVQITTAQGLFEAS